MVRRVRQGSILICIVHRNMSEGFESLKKVSMPDGYFMPGNEAPEKPAEQNLAMSCIDFGFDGEEYRPYKKGVFSDQYGKFFEAEDYPMIYGFYFCRPNIKKP